ncbi:uncharacterized protein LOC125244425 [Megalobrama amblycephala]|uniref:uncharacterized protein LOC125244425 n=1 Tax=Megalobrama amblycephala TaxID=75352 RepID=UPI0020145104|nr:uncharacterized protein LOC125244425 [Megalobrama amblycephala]
MVTYDVKLNSWHCPCARSRRSCLHKYIAKWHLFQTEHQLFRTVQSTDQTTPVHESVDDTGLLYPPTKELESMIRYVMNNKTIPAALPEHLCLPSFSSTYPTSLIPDEMFCHRCAGNVPLSDPLLITSKAKILTNTRIIHDVATYSKCCHQCGIHYRYQEWKDGLHNFNDSVILDLPLCLHLRNMLQVHTAVGRVVQCLEVTIGEQFPPAKTVLHAYLHFEALTGHEYEYSCVTCGDHPPIVIMDLHRKGAFNMSLSDIKPPPKDFNGHMDMDDFWDKLALQMIGRGFVKKQSDNPFTVHPNYHCWAPWIGRNTRKSSQCLNTEFQKIHQPKEAELCEITVSEDRLKNELYKKKVSVIRKLCRECGIDAIGSKSDLLERLSSEMKSRQTYDKVFEKIWCASESPRDFADVLLSWKHIPNIVIYDFARGLATHTNLRCPETLIFTPHEGRLADPTDGNIKMAKEGKLKISLPWLSIKKQVPDSHGHPITGSAEHYVLNDKFHEDNSKDERDALRKIGLVAQLAGKVNSQVAEQFFSKLKKNNYFLNMTLPSTHVFLMRSIIHHNNSQKNLRRLEAFKKLFGNRSGAEHQPPGCSW